VHIIRKELGSKVPRMDQYSPSLDSVVPLQERMQVPVMEPIHSQDKALDPRPRIETADMTQIWLH
jgi:hypothetical protein